MIDTPYPLDSAILGIAAFAASFVVLYIAWGLVVRFSESFFSKSKFYFVPMALKDIGRSVLVVILLVSAYFGITIHDPELIEGATAKVWGILLIMAFSEIAVRLLLSALDMYYARTKKARNFLSKRIPLFKQTVGLVIYGIGVLLIINYLSYEIGFVMTILGVLFLVFAFVLFRGRLRNIMAALQLADRINEGDYIESGGRGGFVESILDQHTMLRDFDGRAVSVPNRELVNSSLENSSSADGNIFRLRVGIAGKDFKKAKARLSAACGKVALALEEVLDEYKPKVHLVEIEGERAVFSVKFVAKTGSDMRKVVDAFALAVKSEFRAGLGGLELA